VIMLDVDHFKRFNDAWGHEGGDAVLKELSGLLRRTFRGEDVSCRYGGEEFVVVLADASLEAGQERAEQLRRQVGELSVRLRGEAMGAITVSLGPGGCAQRLARQLNAGPPLPGPIPCAQTFNAKETPPTRTRNTPRATLPPLEHIHVWRTA
jgi:diguanylate cyclase (GGDEF)-like protein